MRAETGTSRNRSSVLSSNDRASGSESIDPVLKARNRSPNFILFGARELGSTNPFRAKDPSRA